MSHTDSNTSSNQSEADPKLREFEQRTRQLLQESVDGLDAATRSKLTQARHAALEAATNRRRIPGLGFWAPAGVLASAVLATVLVLAPGQRASDSVNVASGETFEDLELLADAEALELAQEDDLEFLEWAAIVAADESMGTGA